MDEAAEVLELVRQLKEAQEVGPLAWIKDYVTPLVLTAIAVIAQSLSARVGNVQRLLEHNASALTSLVADLDDPESTAAHSAAQLGLITLALRKQLFFNRYVRRANFEIMKGSGVEPEKILEVERGEEGDEL